MDEIKQIILIGMNRSGTKWLSNIFSNHPDIISIQHERGSGIQETNMFDKFQTIFGNLTYPDNYVALIECWSQTDFFKLTKLDKELLYKLNPRPINYFDLFKIVMDDLARKNNKIFWLQKTNPFNVRKCLHHYNNAHFIAIKRNIIDTLKSNIHVLRTRGARRKKIIKETFFYVYQEKFLNELIQNNSVSFVTFEDLKANPAIIASGICNKIGIEFNESMLHIPFSKNTSFKSASDRDKVFSKTEVLIIKLFSKILSNIPLFVFIIIHNLLRKENTDIIPGTFGYIKDKYNIT